MHQLSAFNSAMVFPILCRPLDDEHRHRAAKDQDDLETGGLEVGAVDGWLPCANGDLHQAHETARALPQQGCGQTASFIPLLQIKTNPLVADLKSTNHEFEYNLSEKALFLWVLRAARHR